MTPIFLISPPRAKATLLMRTLDATPEITMAGESDDFVSRLHRLFNHRPKFRAQWASEDWPRHRLEGNDSAWRQSIRGMLEGWIGPRPGSEFMGLRLSYLGREDWATALREWSWLLEMWPEAKIVFLTRDQGEVELSMLATPHLRWVPEYGKCLTCAGGRVKRVMESMTDFHILNPTRTAILDASQFEDFDATAGVLNALGIPLDRDAWERELAIHSGTRKQLGLPPPAPPGDPAFDPFHPLATAEDFDAHQAAMMARETPKFLEIDPFAEDFPVEKLLEISPPRAVATEWETIPKEPKTLKLPDGYKPRRPRRFKVRPANHPRAIVYPWLAKGAVWEELRYSIRSVEKHFADKDCPIYVLGDAPPKWLVPGGRVKWMEMRGYRRSQRDGLFEARAVGLQLAEEVLWMNDDFYLLKDCGWDDFRVALTCGDLVNQVPRLQAGRIGDFSKGKILAAFDLIANGCPRVMNYAVHAPFLFERTKAVEILKRFHINHRGGLETLYHNWHATPNEPQGELLANALPVKQGARTLNHRNSGPGLETAWHMQRMFPDAGPYENPLEMPEIRESIPLATVEIDDGLAAGRLEVYTLRYGSPDWLKLCAPAMDEWCERHGYRMNVFGHPGHGLPDEKFATVAMIRHFLETGSDFMLFVDADVIPAPNAPRWPELPGFAAGGDFVLTTLRKWDRWKASKRIETPGWKYRNSGVWSCDRDAARRFLDETEQGPWLLGMLEQHQFNVWWHRATEKGMTMSELPPVWNCLASYNVHPAWFYHLAGQEKAGMVERLKILGLLPRGERRFLVYCPTGGAPTPELFGEDRTFDVALNYYEEAGELPAEYSFSIPGQKLWTAAEAMREIDMSRYDAIAILDDDLTVSAEQINRLFEFGIEHGLSMWQPALTPESFHSHGHTIQREGKTHRRAPFVEMMAPFFSREALVKCLPSFQRNESGWGLDSIVWPRLLDQKGIAIVDSIPVGHMRPIQSHKIKLANGKTPHQELAEIQAVSEVDTA